MDRDIINNIKNLAIDMINEAKSGHPGIVLSAAPIIYTLYAKHLNINLNDPNWINRDRFVMSAGHGSALLYATLHMAGFDITIEDLKNFRKIGKTPGHPEYGVTPGVEMSTGPLGQGFASAVGMALGSKILEQKFSLPKKSKMGKNRSLINYNVYVLCGDGDLMEGIASEAASLAGTWNLNNLIVLYDSNNVCLDGKTDNVFTENVLAKFEAMGWHTELVKDGLSASDIDKAITKAKTVNKPSLIEVKTVIGYGSMLQGSNEVHGKILDKNDIDQLKVKLGVTPEPFFINPPAINAFRKQIYDHSSKPYEEWTICYKDYLNEILDNKTSALDFLYDRTNNFMLPEELNMDSKKEALRDSNGHMMNVIAPYIPNFVGGSADLASSTKVKLYHSEDISYPEYKGKNINFGVREHSMGAILNGLSLSKLRPFGSTFLTFADYLKPAIRMSALMELPVTYIFTHDSVSVGEDGPTHQPIEQLAMLRSIPNVKVYRPSDKNELIGCWSCIMNSHKNPSVLVISKQEVDLLEDSSPQKTTYGGYVVQKEKEKIHAIIIASGSEVQTATYIAKDLYEKYKLDLRIVSMPSKEVFLNQTSEYQESILPKGYRTIVIEAGSSYGWEGFVYNNNYLITLNSFGISGRKNEVLKHMNFDLDSIKERIEKLLLK